MDLKEHFEFLEPDHIRIKGHRVAIEAILWKYLAGEPAEQIVRQYDTLQPVDVYAAITYYLEHTAEMDAYLQRVDQLVTEDMARSDANPSPTVRRLRKLREQRAGAPT